MSIGASSGGGVHKLLIIQTCLQEEARSSQVQKPVSASIAMTLAKCLIRSSKTIQHANILSQSFVCKFNILGFYLKKNTRRKQKEKKRRGSQNGKGRDMVLRERAV